MKNRRFCISLGGVAILVGAFLLLDFHCAVSSAQAEKNVNTASMGDGLPAAKQSREKINIVLVGQGKMASAVEKALAAEMDNAGMGHFEISQTLEPAYPNPVMIVKVGTTRLLWTPFFATGQISMQAGYLSTGDTAFMEKTPITIDNKNGPILNMYGEFKVSDHSWGLISRPGYHQILANHLAEQIVATLKDLYGKPAVQAAPEKTIPLQKGRK
jgi:hypothetical protein